jgi:DNA polymerase-3 subunit delta
MIAIYFGPDEYMRSEAIKQLLATIPDAARSLNVVRLDGKRFKLEALMNACEAFPFLHDRRLVIVDDLLKHQKAGKERDELKTYLDKLPAWADVLFNENEEFDKRNAIFNHISKIGQVQEFLHPKETELIRWIGEQARARQVVIDNAATARLIALVGNNGRTLINELDKLANYVRPGGSINESVVQLMVADDTEQNLFTFIDEMAARRKGAALAKLRKLIADGQAPQYIIFMIARQIRILLQVRELDLARTRPNDIAAKVGLRPGFLTDKAIQQARGFRADELERLHERLLSLDHKSKTGGVDVLAGLDLLVMEA